MGEHTSSRGLEEATAADMERRRRRPSTEDATLVRAAPAHQLLHRAATTFGSTQGVTAWSDWVFGSAPARLPGLSRVHTWWLRRLLAARHSQEGPGPLGVQPPPLITVQASLLDRRCTHLDRAGTAEDYTLSLD